MPETFLGIKLSMMLKFKGIDENTKFSLNKILKYRLLLCLASVVGHKTNNGADTLLGIVVTGD